MLVTRSSLFAISCLALLLGMTTGYQNCGPKGGGDALSSANSKSNSIKRATSSTDPDDLEQLRPDIPGTGSTTYRCHAKLESRFVNAQGVGIPTCHPNHPSASGTCHRNLESQIETIINRDTEDEAADACVLLFNIEMQKMCAFMGQDVFTSAYLVLRKSAGKGNGFTGRQFRMRRGNTNPATGKVTGDPLRCADQVIHTSDLEGYNSNN